MLMSHLVCNDVRLDIRHLPAALHHKCDIPGNIHDPHVNLRPLTPLMFNEGTPPFSGEIRYSTVRQCDGNGLVVGMNLDHTDPLQNA